MRGHDEQQWEMFSYGSLEQRVAGDHPLRRIHALVSAVLGRMGGRFGDLYAQPAAPRSPPSACCAPCCWRCSTASAASERALMEHIDLHLGFRWFVGLRANEAVWDASTFSKNRARLLEGDVAVAFFKEVLEEARRRHWLSDERFTVDGTLIEAWASKSSYQRKQDPPAPGSGSGRDGQLQKRDLSESKTDPEAHMYRKSGAGAFALSYLGHVLADQRKGLIAGVCVTRATARAERAAAVEMVRGLAHRGKRIRGAADKAYDETEFVRQMRALGATPQVTQYTGRRSSAIDGRTTRHASYREGQYARRHVERIFGWLKQVGGQRRTRFRGREHVGWMFTFAASAYNLLRMMNLSAQPA